MNARILLAAIGLSLPLIGTAEAGQIQDLQLFDGTGGSATVTINYTNADGTGSTSAYCYADPQVNDNTTAPMYYCVDLWHDNYLGSTYTITQVATMAFSDSTFSDVDNRIAWLLTQPQSTADERGAVQLAIWYTVDNVNSGFSYSGGDGTMRSDYNALIGFAGYDPAVSDSADFFQATHDSTNTLYQDLVSAPGGNFGVQSVPEPGSVVLAGIAVLALAGVGLRRRLALTADV
jgi:hypothetical protein